MQRATTGYDRGPTLPRCPQRAPIRAEWAIGRFRVRRVQTRLGNQPPEVGIRLSLCLIELVHPPLVGTLSEAGGVSITEEVNIVGAEGHF